MDRLSRLPGRDGGCCICLRATGQAWHHADGVAYAIASPNDHVLGDPLGSRSPNDDACTGHVYAGAPLPCPDASPIDCNTTAHDPATYAHAHADPATGTRNDHPL